MGAFQVLRHTFTQSELTILDDAIDYYIKSSKAEVGYKHQAAAIQLYLKNVHRLSVSYIQEIK